MNDIFISYSSQNEKQAKTILKKLQDNGFSCWFAPAAIRGTQNFAREIPPAIRASRAFLLLLTKESQDSVWVLRELGEADANKIPIYTVFLEDFELRDEFRFILRFNQHYSPAKDGNKAIERLVQEIKADFADESIKKEETAPQKNKKPIFAAVIALILAAAAIITCVTVFTRGSEKSEYVISCPAYNIALSSTPASNSHYLAGKTLGAASQADADCRWQIDYINNSTITLSCNGVNLGIQPGYNGIGIGGDFTADEWKIIEDSDGCVYLQNTETLSYLEWYADKENWANHDKLTPETKDMFLLKLDKVS